MRVAVAGGTGVVGTHVVAALQTNGHEVDVLSRSRGVDLLDGSQAAATALAHRLVGVDAVVDALSVVTMRADESTRFFEATTRALLEAEAAVGVGHHVVISIVGIDEVPLDYYVGKIAQERAVRSSAAGWTVLRATQFHEFGGQMLDRLRLGPVALAPSLPVAPVAAREVGAAVADLATGRARNAVLEMGGPERGDLRVMIRETARRRGTPRIVVPVRVPGRYGRLVREGHLVPREPDLRGTQTFTEWLREQ